MHRINTSDAYPAGTFSEGDPTVPRLPTQVSAGWLQDVQEELAAAILATYRSLATSAGTVQLGAVFTDLWERMPRAEGLVRITTGGVVTVVESRGLRAGNPPPDINPANNTLRVFLELYPAVPGNLRGWAAVRQASSAASPLTAVVGDVGVLPFGGSPRPFAEIMVFDSAGARVDLSTVGSISVAFGLHADASGTA